MEKLHLKYCELTGFNISLRDYGRERAWFEWAKRFKADDLDLVVNYLKREIRKGERNLGALKFHNLVEQLDYFEEDLAMARVQARIPTPTPRDTFLASVGRAPAQPEQAARPISEILPAVWKAGCDEMRKAL